MGTPYGATCYYKSATTTAASAAAIVTKCNEPNNKVTNTWEPGPAVP